MLIKTLYLAGPDVFYPNAADLGRQKQSVVPVTQVGGLVSTG